MEAALVKHPAIKKQEVSARKVDYVNAHGTGTQQRLQRSNFTRWALKTAADKVHFGQQIAMTGHLLGAIAGAIEDCRGAKAA